MKYDPSDKLIEAGLNLIQEIDPMLYIKMLHDNWDVSSDIYRLGRLRPDDDVWRRGMDETIRAAFGATISDHLTNPAAVSLGLDVPNVVVNEREITKWANAHNLRPVSLVATTLAHEFVHVHQPDNLYPGDWRNELPAFNEGTRLARLLPASDAGPIVQMSEDSANQLRELRDDGLMDTVMRTQYA